MKTIGLLGGMGWASTIEYYRFINQAAAQKFGGLHSARILLYSFEHEEIYDPMKEGRHQDIVEKFVKAAHWLKSGGADFFLLCSNTSHFYADEVAKQVSIPLINIADVTAKAIKAKGLQKVGLLGTKFTLQKDFYKHRLKSHGISTVLPSSADIEATTNIITHELNQLKILPESRQIYLETIERLKGEGAQGVILGCTEIPLLIQQKHVALPVFDTTYLHAMAAAEAAFS